MTDVTPAILSRVFDARLWRPIHTAHINGLWRP